VQFYRARLSGPLLDRIDMHVEVPAVAARELTRGVRRKRGAAEGSAVRSPESGSLAGESEPESSASVRERVLLARRVQEVRFGGESIHCNAQMGIREIEGYCRVDDGTRALLHKAMETRSMSARAAHRVLRVARTIADLANAGEIAAEHVAEAVQYQSLTT
jgi:magnesium chelatase family protein